jgi:hypothetical protein
VEGEELAKLNRVLRSTQDESAAPRRAPARSHKKSR